MNDFRDEQNSERDQDFFARSAMAGMDTAARSLRVNRTHRVVRERAMDRQHAVLLLVHP